MTAKDLLAKLRWFAVHWPDGHRHNATLMDVVLGDMRLVPFSQLGVGTGWSGPKTFFQHEATQPLLAFVLEQLPSDVAWEVSGWANAMRTGDAVRPHDHVRSHLGGANTWAGVYYVVTPPGSGALLLDGHRIEPTPSQLVIFPAATEHAVEPYRGHEMRVSIAFNVRPQPV